MLENLWPEKDWASEHLKDTPKRFARMLKELTTPEPFTFTTFPSDSDEMVICKDITFNSLCAHHLVPYMGIAHVAYIPSGYIVGLSKIPRLIRCTASDLTVQEDLTERIARTIEDNLCPVGVGVVMEAEHMCATLRGVKAAGMKTITSCMRGAFADHNKLARAEFLQFIK
jgi:GTP cyclohydrolase I